MIKRYHLIKTMIQLMLIFGFSVHTFSQVNKRVVSESEGPKNGTLFIGGGGVHKGMNADMWKIFRQYAGNDTARLVIIPTSWGDNSLKYDTTFTVLKNEFKAYGFNDIEVIHTKDRDIANTQSFVKPLQKATAVWLSGGRQWRSADVYLDTKVHEELFNLLDRGGIIGGTSAGASIQGSFLARGNREEDGGFYIMGGQETGFGFISNIAIDQHHLVRNRQYDMFELLERKPEILGIGIDENTAILVKNNQFEVIGERYVAIYDGTFWSPYFNDIDTLERDEEKFYFLSNGCKYDLKKRQVIVNKYLSHEKLDSSKFIDYVGKYQLGEGRYWFDVFIKNDTLFLQRTMRDNVNQPIAVFPNGNDNFFDKGSTWWYHFQRNDKNQIIGMIRDENKLMNDRVLKFHKLDK
ncbi:MAG: cyanophycinase [Bacteroidetes bacterium]|nr:cyanophycinase [Bacteroidota bacterium]